MQQSTVNAFIYCYRKPQQRSHMTDVPQAFRLKTNKLTGTPATLSTSNPIFQSECGCEIDRPSKSSTNFLLFFV